MEASYTRLKAWEHGYGLALAAYKAVADFPANEKFGLISQMQRSASSVPFNIAEGYARVSQKEKIQFYSIARGSLAELETQLRLSKDIGYLRQDNYEALMERAEATYKLLNALIKAIQTSLKTPKY